jgi:polysaccharide pyruvyl transferase WcaK-like protein
LFTGQGAETRLAHDWPGRLGAAMRISAFAASLDLLVISGGGQLDDFWGGAWGHPWSLLLWTALARRHGVPTAFLAVGFDRLSTPLSRSFTRWALQLARYRSFRDTGSLDAVRAIGLRAEASVCPDLAFGLTLPPLDALTALGPERFAVINPVARRTWSAVEDTRHDSYLQGLAAIGAWLVQQGLALRIACSQANMDKPDAVRIADMLSVRGASSVKVVATNTVKSYLDAVTGAELVVGSRLHGVILSLVVGSPVIALAPLPKVERLMGDVGLGQYCRPLHDFRVDEVCRLAADVLKNNAQLREKISASNKTFRTEIDSVFDELVALI